MIFIVELFDTEGVDHPLIKKGFHLFGLVRRLKDQIILTALIVCKSSSSVDQLGDTAT